MVDSSRLGRVEFPYLPQLRAPTLLAGVRAHISRRDARHYYHALACGERWSLLFGGPLVTHRGRRAVPLMRAWPMGFRGSATVVHRLTERVCHDAGLPAACRAAPSVPCPLSALVWGAIMDDVWSITTDEETPQMRTAFDWMPSVGAQWHRHGVPSHEKKRVDFAEGEDIQGAHLHPTRHVLGLSADKLAALIVGVLRVAASWRPARQALERMVDKVGHAHCFRLCLRSGLQRVHGALRRARGSKSSRVVMTDLLQEELVTTAFLLPLARIDFQAHWASRVVCSDAAPGGHALAYTFLPEREVQDWAHLASHRGDFTTLLQEIGVPAAPREQSHLKAADLDLGQHQWRLVGRPGQYEVIALEDYDAYLRGLESRLRYRSELHSRCVHIGDNSTQVGAEVKGRSSAFRLNARCRRSCAIQCAGDLTPFVLWERSGKNPADAPSGWCGSRASHRCAVGSFEPMPPPDLAGSSTRRSTALFLCLKGGAFNAEGFGEPLREWMLQVGLAIEVLVFDLTSSGPHCLLNPVDFSALRNLCWSGRVLGVVTVPPTSSWATGRVPQGRHSRWRHQARPFGLPCLLPSAQHVCDEESGWLLRCVDLHEGVLRAGGQTLMMCAGDFTEPRHIASPFRVPSSTSQLERHRGSVFLIDQCRYWARGRRRVTLGGSPAGLEVLAARCSHRRHNHRERDAPFSPPLLRAISAACADRWVAQGARAAGRQCSRPPPWRGLAGVTALGRPSRPLPAPRRDVWPLAPRFRLLDEPVAPGDPADVPRAPCPL